jgi:hypothetical protein
MKTAMRVMSALVLLLLGLAIVAWLVATQTDTAGQLATTMFNSDDEQVTIAVDSARLGSSLLGGSVSGLVLSEKRRGHALFSLGQAEVALGSFPSDEGVDIERISVDGLQLRLDEESLALLQAQGARFESAAEEPPEAVPEDGSEVAPTDKIVRLGLVEVKNVDVEFKGGGWEISAPTTSLELAGVTGTNTQLEFSLDVAPSGARGPGVDAKTGALRAQASLQATPKKSHGLLTIKSLSLETLEALGASLRGLKLSSLAVEVRGLSLKVNLAELMIDAATALGMSVTNGALALSLAGSLTGAKLDALKFRSSELRLDAKGSAALSIGFSGRKLPYSLSGSFAVTPAQLSPLRCKRPGLVTGRFDLRGDLLAGGHHVTASELRTSAGTRGDEASDSVEAQKTARPWQVEALQLRGASDWLSIPGWICPPPPSTATPDPEEAPDGARRTATDQAPRTATTP